MSGTIGLIKSLMDAMTQETRLLRLHTALGADALLAECVRGEESLSGGFRFQVSALSTDPSISLRALIGQPALLEVQIAADGGRRPIHGHVTAAEFNGSNGGLARYTLTIEPWTAFLSRNRDSRVFQDRSVPDILDAVFATWSGQGRLAPQWRFDLAARDRYPVRSLTTQYQESDLAFAERLMQEEGLFYYFEHSGDVDAGDAGSHVLVIADDSTQLPANAQSVIRYTQPGAVMREDAIDRWRSASTLRTNAIALRSWDYRTLSSRPVQTAASSGNGQELPSSDVPGSYAYSSREQGQRLAEIQLQALEARKQVFTGAGTVRTLAAGTKFTLADNDVVTAADPAAEFLVVRVVHLMHNNLGAELGAGTERLLGQAPLAAVIEDEQRTSLHAAGRTIAQRPVYRNRFEAIRASVPWRPAGTDDAGVRLRPRPTIQGQQTAIVVGPAGATVHTDRDHRVKVQFHWQRGDSAHSRLADPAAGSHTGAPADDRAGTWVRVATSLAPVAGANWGANAVPRVGQEVLVDFLDGDIDRPVVIGTVYNGRGQEDAQHNQVAQGGGASTGNAPAWFPGSAGAHAHPATLSGLKSQALPASQEGGGGYGQLVFDDTAGHPRVALQRHASQYDGAAELNLGDLRHHADNQRLHAVGFGAELNAGHSTALRAGKGMLVSTDARAGGSGNQLDAREAHAQIGQSHALQSSLGETAQAHNARLKTPQGADEPKPDSLPALKQLAATAAAIDGAGTGSAGGDSGGMGTATAFGAPVLQMSSPAGIAVLTPASAVVAAGATSSVAAGQDINHAAQANAAAVVRDGIGLFTYGKADDPAKPVAATGIRLHAASGKVSMQSQGDATRLTADRLVTVASVAKGIQVTAKEHVMLTAQGAYLKLEGGDIMIHGPGTMSFKSSMKELTGPAQSKPELPELPNEKLYAGRFQVLDKESGGAIAGRLYRKEREDGKVFFGRTDADGHTTAVNTRNEENLAISLDAQEKFHREKIDEEEVNRWLFGEQ